jgi:prevent-host-death family protein
MPTRVNVREFKAHLSTYLRRVKAGEVVEIAERGKPIGRIVPVGVSLEDVVTTLREEGLVEWSGRRLPDRAPVALVRGKGTVAELLVEDRG